MAAGATGIVGVSSGGTFNAAGVVTKDYGALANDSTAPDVAFTSPADRSTVSGTVALAVNANDAGSGVEKVDFYVESNRIGTDMTAPFEANWDSTTSTNNPHRVLAVATDRNGNVRSAGITLTPNNASRPRISQFVSATVVNGSIVTMTFNIRNDGPGDVTNVTLQQFWAEGTGAGIVGIRRLNASPTDGTVLPRNFGALMPGQTATVDLRFFVPVGVDQFRRWVSHGTVVSGGATINL
jgi:uncharacterized repeat protein (TIGR01451 family)